MLWQLAYTELFFLNKLWPDFQVKDLNRIISIYKKRKRNFGKVWSLKFKKRLYTSIFLIILTILVFIYMPLLVFVLLVVGNFSMIEFSQIIKKISKK